MPEVVLHVGAHRTGTTSVQRYLSKNKKTLLEKGVYTLFPPETRNYPIDLSSCEHHRVLISEENILGAMGNNIRKGVLYPNVDNMLNRYKLILNEVQVVFLSIRNTVDWWSSATSFVAGKNGNTLPSQGKMEEVSDGSRQWSDVIDDIQQVMPNAEIVVREFCWKLDNPRQQLQDATRWKDWAETKFDKTKNNQRPTITDMAVAFSEKGDFKSLSRLPEGRYYSPFSKQITHKLDDKYIEDLQVIGKKSNVRFLVDMDAVHSSIRERRNDF